MKIFRKLQAHSIANVVTILVRGLYRSTWFNGVATDLFCTGVIDHPEMSFLN